MSSSARESIVWEGSGHADVNPTSDTLEDAQGDVAGRRPGPNIVKLDDARFSVVDWRPESLPDPEESVYLRPHHTAFANMEQLSEYIREPAPVPTRARLIHMMNPPTFPQRYRYMYHRHDDSGKGFATWSSPGARKEAVDLSCFAWEADTSSVGLNWKDWESKTSCSFDYFGLCKDSNITPLECCYDKHSLSFRKARRRISGEESDPTYTACPRRISVLVHHGPPNRESFDDSNPHDPAFVVIVSEDVPHPCRAIFGSSLSFSVRDGLDYPGRIKVAKKIVHVLFRSVSDSWISVLRAGVEHSRYLEDCVYDKPDDESQSPALWAASKSWMTIERLLRAHVTVLGEFERSFETVILEAELARVNNDPDDQQETRIPGKYHEDVHKTLERCIVQVQNDLIKPTTNLLDMLYKSVAIRDARLSLELNASLWRLSWITFIFLPLTFLSGFFGMNVDLFSDNPSIKWYFISAAALVALFFLMWLGIRLAHKRKISFGRQYKSYRNMV